MKTIAKITTEITCLILLSIQTIHAQQTNFGGTWTLNKTKTDFGKAPEWILPKTISIKQEKNQVTITRANLDAQYAEHPATETLIDSGLPTETTSYTGAKRTAALKWETGGKSFVIVSSTIGVDGKSGSKINETWALQDNGKTLLIERQVEQANGLKYTIKAYYDRQP